MMRIRRSRDRGHFDHGWLDTYHTFSFGDYFDAKHTAFRALRVINEDVVAPDAGFPAHPHRDMEIVTYVLEGALRHRDSMGNGSVIRPGDVQRMSAGTGVTHSEHNASKTEPVHLLQIWIYPQRNGLAPGYEQKAFADAEKRGRLRLVASPDGREGSVTIHQDAELYATLLAAGETLRQEGKPGRHAWVQVARGGVKLNGRELSAGDGAALTGEKTIALTGVRDAEVLLFDLA
jgi:redox-sensitive bicupin YhaK (pirin superfamily)